MINVDNYQIFLGASHGPVFVPAKYLNRHGLIAGATGTGKSVSLMGLAESLSRVGVPSFVTDIKGDLSGLGAPSLFSPTDPAALRAPAWRPEAAPLALLDVYADKGNPLSTTIRAMGAPLVARALSLSDAQSGVLEVAFAVTEDYEMPLNTLADLRAAVSYCEENRAEIGRAYGLVTPSSVAAIGRAILRLERGGGASFFGSNPMDISAFMSVDGVGRGVVSLLDCVRLIREPRLYAAVLLALLDALAKELPEIGDTDRPKFALFFDEAHLIFSDCPTELLRAVENTVRLIRSKGVGVFFASQMPSDVPDAIARQLHLRIQHSLRAVTPSDRSMVRAAAESMPPAADFKAVDVIGNLGKGEALVSYMDNNGQVTPCQRLMMALPRCRLSPLSDVERAALYVKPKAENVNRPAPNVKQEEAKPANYSGLWIIFWLVVACALNAAWLVKWLPTLDILPFFIWLPFACFPFLIVMGLVARMHKSANA